MTPIDFFFDFISPYAYLASRRIDDLAQRHRRAVRWHPFRLGVAVVKVMGLKPVMETPLKADYVARDIVRLAKLLRVPLVFTGALPDPAPPARLFYGAAPERAADLAKALLSAQWGDGRDIGGTEVLLDVALKAGLDEQASRRSLQDPATQDAWNAATRRAIERGVFGSPTCAVGEALFWGTDRLWVLEEYLLHGERYDALDASESANQPSPSHSRSTFARVADQVHCGDLRPAGQPARATLNRRLD